MEHHTQFTHLFRPIQVGPVVYKNRIAATPLGNTSVRPDGSFPAASFQMYRDRAAGGCAEVAASETVVDFQYGSRVCVPPVDYTDLSSPRLRGLRQYSDMLHSYGAVATVELNHCGANRFPSAGRIALGPCAIEDNAGVRVLAMDEGMMQEVEERFAQAAWYMKQAGYDGVIPHMASGWLLQQFLSPVTNHRTDAYGGSAENRMRFPLRVLRAIRARCGDDFLIAPRLACSEYIPGGNGIEDAVSFCRLMEGLVDLVGVTAGVYYEPVRSGEFSSMFDPHNLHWSLAAAIKRRCSLPVMLTGGINAPEVAERLIAEGVCDLVGLGRQMLADPAWARKAQEGRAEDIARCIRCFRCFPGPLQDTGGRMLTPPDKKCTVNPCADLSELNPPLQQWPRPQERRRVLVVGGGIGGLTAAYTAAQCGHRVTLLEKTDRLGGLLTFSDYDADKRDLCRYKELCIRRVREAGVEVHLNWEATPDNIAAIPADEVILAVGSSPLRPSIPGIEATVPVLQAYQAPETLGSRVVVAGGGQVGCETALHLIQTGRHVTVVELREAVAIDANPMHRVALMDRLEKSGVELRCGLKCIRFTDTGAMSEDMAGDTVLIPGDHVVLALGMRANRETAQALEHALAGRARVQMVGDCWEASRVQVAVEQGFLAARRIV
ncbi:MAG: FAD-dependent oxidoreductase [Oscillospiraceae bacterium]|nr:FAD-dependent oxidoreductase [Oscillospiraceae bacterium]